MPTVVKTIGSAGGRDFSTPATWEASLPANLVTDGNSYEGDCYNDSEFTSSSVILTLSGHTTDATHTITFTTGAGQSFRDNANAQTNALKYNASNGVGLNSSSTTATISITDTNVFVSKVQITNTTNYGSALVEGSGGANTYDFLLIDSSDKPVAMSTSASVVLRNSVLIGRRANTSGLSQDHGFKGYFLTIVCPSDVANSQPAIVGNYGSGILENIAIFGFASIFSSNTTWTITTCMTDVASPPAGFTGSKTYANQFQNTTNASGDWREKSGADLQGAGTSDSTNGAHDIVGTARPQGSNWDIGCWELVAASTGLGALLSNYEGQLIGAGLVLA